MNHTLLAWLFFGLIFVVTILTGYFVYGFMLKQVSDNRMKYVAGGWVLVIGLGMVARYYTTWFMEDHRPSLFQQAQFPAYFICLFAAAMIARARAKRLTQREK